LDCVEKEITLALSSVKKTIKNDKPMKKSLTQTEVEVLANVAALQVEDNYSEYTSVKSNEEKGILGSLVKKGLIYDCYEGMDMGYMYCLTEDGFQACRENEIDTDHIELH
jgi:hypothetical protein